MDNSMNGNNVKETDSDSSYVAVESNMQVSSKKAPIFLTISYATVWLLAIGYILYLHRRIKKLALDLSGDNGTR